MTKQCQTCRTKGNNHSLSQSDNRKCDKMMKGTCKSGSTRGEHRRSVYQRNVHEFSKRRCHWRKGRWIETVQICATICWSAIWKKDKQTADKPHHVTSYSFICPPEYWFPAKFGWQHGSVSFANKRVKLEVRWSLNKNVFVSKKPADDDANLRHRSSRAVWTCRNFLPVLSLAPPFLFLASKQFDYHIFSRNYYCCYSSCACLKSSEMRRKKKFSLYFTVFKVDRYEKFRKVAVGSSRWITASGISMIIRNNSSYLFVLQC